MTAYDRADALAKSRGYIGLWCIPHDLRESMIEEARLPRSMDEILATQVRDHTSPFAPVRIRPPYGNQGVRK